MGSLRLKFIFACIVAFFFVPLSATHVVGGEITYRYIGKDTYAVRLDLFIDCLNGNPGAISSDATAYFYVFSKTSGQLVAGFPVEIPRSGPERLVKVNYNCLGNLPNACVDHYWYETDMHLPRYKGDYIISFQRCCRNGSITNLLNPLDQGANYWTTVPDPISLPDTMPNSSAVFKELPPNFLCINAPLKFNHSATDADGDSLAYDLFMPYLGATPSQPRPDNSSNGLPDYPPFNNIVYTGSYTSQVPIDGTPPLVINPSTGTLSLIPTRLGQYVVGIRVREYRKGVLISETKRDYQFNVLDCQLNVFASFSFPNHVCDTLVHFTSTSVNAAFYHWDFGVPSVLSDTSAERNPTFGYSTPGIYKVQLQVQGNNCTDTAEDTVRVGKKYGAVAKADVSPCAITTTFSANTAAPKVLWLLDNKQYTQNPLKLKMAGGNYKIKLFTIDTIAGCNDTQTLDVTIDPGIVDVRLANVFTPNTDGFNDCYHIGGNTDCVKGKILIFNRWGERIFASENLAFCWNGKVNNEGAELPEGVYFYQLYLEPLKDASKQQLISGSIHLLR